MPNTLAEPSTGETGQTETLDVAALDADLESRVDGMLAHGTSPAPADEDEQGEAQPEAWAATFDMSEFATVETVLQAARDEENAWAETASARPHAERGDEDGETAQPTTGDKSQEAPVPARNQGADQNADKETATSEAEGTEEDATDEPTGHEVPHLHNTACEHESAPSHAATSSTPHQPAQQSSPRTPTLRHRVNPLRRYAQLLWRRLSRFPRPRLPAIARGSSGKELIHPLLVMFNRPLQRLSPETRNLVGYAGLLTLLNALALLIYGVIR